VHAAERGVAGRDVGHHHAQRAHVHHLRRAGACPASSSRCCRCAWAGHRPRPGCRGLQVAAHLEAGLHAGLALHALLVQQLGDAAVFVALQEAEGQVLQLPLDLPDAQAVGQRREHGLGLFGQGHRAVAFAGGEPAQRLQARGQAQQHHAQVAREGQQHLAHALGLLGALGVAQLGFARGALDLHQLAGEHHQAGVRRPEGLLDHVLGRCRKSAA
jgi:hypothetical protein